MKLLVKLLDFLGFKVKYEKNGRYGSTWQLDGFRFLPLNWIITLFGVYVGLTLIFGSWFMLDKTERASVEHFGAFSHEVGPGGIYFKCPFISSVQKVPTEMRHRWELGFRTEGEKYKEISSEATMLTKGGHLGSIYWIFQYTINDVYTWLYTVKDPEAVLDKLGQGSMRLVSGQTSLDDFLTTQKIEIQEKNKKLFQDYCKLIGLNTTINEVKLQDCSLPDPEVQQAYDDVMNAEKDKDATKQKAQGYHNDVVPKASGKASQIINAANSYYTQQVNGAKGEIALFMGVLEEYRKDPVTTEKKLWYEAMQTVLPEAKKTIIENQGLLNLKQY
jgi:membrane protease subunit HflK